LKAIELLVDGPSYLAFVVDSTEPNQATTFVYQDIWQVLSRKLMELDTSRVV